MLWCSAVWHLEQKLGWWHFEDIESGSSTVVWGEHAVWEGRGFQSLLMDMHVNCTNY